MLQPLRHAHWVRRVVSSSGAFRPFCRSFPVAAICGSNGDYYSYATELMKSGHSPVFASEQPINQACLQL